MKSYIFKTNSLKICRLKDEIIDLINKYDQNLPENVRGGRLLDVVFGIKMLQGFHKTAQF